MTPPPLPPIPPQDFGNDKWLAILCHLSPFIGFPFILPLIVLLAKGAESAWIAAHAKEVLNFHISLAIYCLVALFPLMLCFIGIPIFFGLILLSFICAILGAIRASEGGFFFYPLTIRIIS